MLPMTCTRFNALALLSLLLVNIGDARELSCPLTCANGGQCRLQGAIEVATSDGSTPTTPSATSYYCKCPRGFWGPSCEIQFVLCPSRNDTCFNGEPCYRDVDHDGEPYYRCQCDISSRASTDMDSPYTYRLCAHAATTFCNRLSDGSSSGKGSGQDVTLGPSGGSYCSNAGKCKSPVRNDTLHPGCDCPAGWTGNFCEIPVGYEAKAEAAEQESMGGTNESTSGSRSWGSVLWGVLSGLAILLVGLAIMYWWYIGFDDLFDAVHEWFRPSQDRSQSQDRPRRSRAGARRRRRRRQKPRDPPEVELAPTTKATKAIQEDAMGETDEDSDDDIDDEEEDNGVQESGSDNA